GDGPAAERIREAMNISGEGLASICFRVDDIAKACRRLDRVALKPEPIGKAESRDLASDAILRWKRTRVAPELSRGVRMFFLELAEERPRLPAASVAATIARVS